MNFMWVVYTVKDAAADQRQCHGHFLSWDEADNYCYLMCDPERMYIDKISLYDKVNCPFCKSNINIIFWEEPAL